MGVRASLLFACVTFLLSVVSGAVATDDLDADAVVVSSADSSAPLASPDRAASIAGAGSKGSPLQSVTHERGLPDSWGVARFLGAEGRMVLERGEEVVVLRKGESLPGRPGSRLEAIGPRNALLRDADLTKSSGEATRWLLIEPLESGETRVTVVMKQAPKIEVPETGGEQSVVQIVPSGDGVVAVPVKPEQGAGDEESGS